MPHTLDEIAWDRLSARSCNALKTAGITTISALRATSRADLLSLQFLGRTSVDEIESYLESYGGELSVSPDQEGRISPDHRIDFVPTDIQKGLLAKPIAVLSIPVRVRNGLAILGVRYVGEAVQLKPSELLLTKNLGRKSIQQLTAALQPFGLTLRMRPEGWCDETRVAWERDFGPAVEQLIAKNTFSSSLGEDFSNAPLGTQLQALATAVAGQRDGELVVRLLGWAVNPPQTLEAAAQPFGLTRERVRQVLLKFEREVKRRNFRPDWLPVVANVFKENHWVRVSTASDLFQERGIELGQMHPCGLIAALDLFHDERLQLEAPGYGPMKGFIVSADSQSTAKKILSKIRKITSRQGCALVDQLVAWAREEWSGRVDDRLLRDFIEEHPSLEWLSAGREWVWVPDVPRSRLFRPIRQVLAAVDEVSIAELRAAIRRDLHLEGFAPPLDVLTSLLRGLPWCRVSADRVAHASSFPNEDLQGNAGILVDVLKGSGGVMGRYDLINACVARGMNLSTCMVLMLHSATVVPVSPHVFALVGVPVWPSDVDRLTPSAQRARVLQDFGRTADGMLWVSVKASASVITHGLVNVPGSLEQYLQGEFQVATVQSVVDEQGDFEVPPAAFKVRVSQQFVTGLREPLRHAGADIGDTVLMVFDPESRKVTISVGDESLRFAYEE